jgi:lactoylglutathione lyase
MTVLAQKIELFVRDIERSARFYVEALGFERAPTRTVMLAGEELVHAPLRNGPVLLGIGLMSRLPENHHHRRGGADALLGAGVELCFYVADSELDAWYERAKAAGARFGPSGREALGMRPWGARDFRVLDPDDYYVRVTAPDRDYPHPVD